MLHVILFEPEIPPNTGNIIRLCANSGAQLHLIHPLGFAPDDKRMRRAGLDYHEWAHIQHHDNYHKFISMYPNARIFACTTKATQAYDAVQYQDGDMLLFGPETRGLPAHMIQSHASVRIPMLNTSRSINLANAVSIILFEAWRQLKFA